MCENVQISYKAITHKSATNYSYDVAATVNGLKIPEQYPAQVDIDDIETYFQQDGRENYAHHAIATFSWKPPESNKTNFILVVIDNTTNRCRISWKLSPDCIFSN